MGNIILFHDGGGERANTIVACRKLSTSCVKTAISSSPCPTLLGKKRAT